MKLNKIKIGNIKYLLIIAVALLLLPKIAVSQSTNPTGIYGSGLQGLCSGNGNVGGIIPLNNVLNGKSGGTANVLGVALLITLTMLLVVAIIYMLSYVANLDVLKNLAKAEIGEVIITALVVFVFLTAFIGLSGAIGTSNSNSATGIGRSTFTSDCTYLADSSIGLLAPFLGINIVRFIIAIPTSVEINIMPANFGFSIAPLKGLALYDQVLSILDDITGAFILLNLGTLMLLSIIYALFPLFLYAGIVLRTLPWTRAAGGAFLGLFAGFYIAFPILLHIMLAGYIPNAVALSQNASMSWNIASYIEGILGVNSGTGVLTYAASYFSSLSFFGGQYGLINGYIYAVIEPSVFTFFAVIIAFMISFDVAEYTGDILGAPSLRASNLFNKLI